MSLNGLLVSEQTGTAGMTLTVEPSTDFQIDQLRVHLNAVGAGGSLMVTIDDASGVTYDTILFTQDMTLVTDVVWLPTRPILCKDGDKVVVSWANAGGKTYGVKLICRQV
jgi:hypothetical protein